MSVNDLLALLPLLVLSVAAVVVMLTIAFYRDYDVTFALTLLGLVGALVMLPIVRPMAPRQVTPLVLIDGYALLYMGMLLAASLAVGLLAYDYFRVRSGQREEFYLLLLLATLGASVLVTSTHFASFFLGLEILSVSLYAMIGYQRSNPLSTEAGLKYLVLAGTSSAFLLFGMALIYGELGTMEFGRIAELRHAGRASISMLGAGLAMVLVGVGFKLALAPFHLWTPDVYQGAPAPVAAFIASVSKGAMVALVLRYFKQFDPTMETPVVAVFTLLAIASMFVGNLLALLQNNVKRILAYSSITHMGYVLVAFLGAGALAVDAVTYYLVTYFVTILGAFGVVTLLSGRETKDADTWDEYVGLAWRRPWLAGIFTAMLLSLAGLPLTAGFVGKFYVLAAGVDSSLWLLAIMLVINSTIGLFYYLRIAIAMYATVPTQRRGLAAETAPSPTPLPSVAGGLVLAALMILLVWLGVYPAPWISIIQSMVAQVF